MGRLPIYGGLPIYPLKSAGFISPSQKPKTTYLINGPQTGKNNIHLLPTFLFACGVLQQPESPLAMGAWDVGCAELGRVELARRIRKVGYVLLAIATTPQLLARCPSCHDPSLIQLDFWQRTQISSNIWQFFCTNKYENTYRCTIEAVAERLLRSLAFCRGQKGQQPRFTKNVEDVNMSKVAFKSQLSYMSARRGGGGGYLA